MATYTPHSDLGLSVAALEQELLGFKNSQKLLFLGFELAWKVRVWVALEMASLLVCLKAVLA